MKPRLENQERLFFAYLNGDISHEEYNRYIMLAKICTDRETGCIDTTRPEWSDLCDLIMKIYQNKKEAPTQEERNEFTDNFNFLNHDFSKLNS